MLVIACSEHHGNPTKSIAFKYTGVSGRERKMPEEEDDLKALYQKIINAAWMKNALPTKKLFQYLWRHRGKPSPPERLWKDALGNKAAYDGSGNSGATVRDRCRALRAALEDHEKEIRNGWCFSLPRAPETGGYQLQSKRLHDSLSATRAFWQAHLSPGRDVYVAYPELLFYQHWPSHFTFRYFHLNADNDTLALRELKERHPKMYRDNVNAAYPYVAAGDVEARDLITEWFDKNEMVEVKHAITRKKRERGLAESSLVLFRSAASNALIREILAEHAAQHLAFRLEPGGVIANRRRYDRVTIRGAAEMPNTQESQRIAPYNPVPVGSDLQIDFSPDKGVELGILCRIPNPHGGAAVTIFNTESGRFVYQMARLVTDEQRFRKAIDQYDSAAAAQGLSPWPIPMPPSFEILYAMHTGPFPTDDREASLEPLAWRIY
jgi:hypothetical protein